MARKSIGQSKGLSRLQGVASAVKRLFTRGRSTSEDPQSIRSAPMQSAASTSPTPSSRNNRIVADIPLDVLERTYTPQHTSSKAGFRSDGSDHQRDQEFALGVADDRWNDEDRITNKSGDPRIGTHRRTYEPAEDRAGSRE